MEIGKKLFTTRKIQSKVKELAQRISSDYEGKEIFAVGVLKGAAIFFADLIRAITVPLTFDFIIASSYKKMETTGYVNIYGDLREDITGKHVLLVEDIIDTGLTLKFLREKLIERNPQSLRTCVFLDKKERRIVDVPIDYTGFEIPDKYVVGYGLDCESKFRNLPYIAFLEP
ncbi:MAG: hypoxanthine phosphoribosyltransferase [Nitrospirae bacterium]|jgi:hypoxanthine phosphoribosyltransferase|nr:hypoxanthine phosphoribosyltransferase [Nitrospirota bacterium]